MAVHLAGLKDVPTELEYGSGFHLTVMGEKLASGPRLRGTEALHYENNTVSFVDFACGAFDALRLTCANELGPCRSADRLSLWIPPTRPECRYRARSSPTSASGTIPTAQRGHQDSRRPARGEGSGGGGVALAYPPPPAHRPRLHRLVPSPPMAQLHPGSGYPWKLL